MHKKQQAIVVGATGSWAFAVANVFMGIKKHSPNLIDDTDFIVLEQGINEQDKKLLNSIIPCIFKAYKFPLNELKIKHPENYNRFSEMTYSRYECFKMLDEYKKVVWLDVDILIQNDISDLFNYADETGIAFCKEGDNMHWLFTKEWERVEKYDLNVPNVNAGIFVISDKLNNYRNIADWCYKKTIELCDILFLVDQSILNIMFQEFNLKVKYFDIKYNHPFPRIKDTSHACIIHTVDYKKFWNYYKNKEWNQNNEEWIKIGGTVYSGKKINKFGDFFLKKIYYPIVHNRPDPIRHPKKFIASFFKDKKIVPKQELAVVFGITGNWAFALGNTLIGLKEHNSDLKADIIVYYDTLSVRNRIALKKIYSIKFIKYKFPYKNEAKKINNINIFTEMSFCRYECFNLLEKYKKILYLDVDILIQKDISQLINSEAEMILPKGDIATIGTNFTEDVKNYNIDLTLVGYGTGTILFNDKIKNYKRLTKWCYDKTMELAPILYMPDQAAISLLIDEFGIITKKLNELYVYHPEHEKASDAYILHSYTERKFWKDLKNESWEKNNKQWIKLGGSPYDPAWDHSIIPNITRQPNKFIKDFIKRYIS